jgi:hypothetical protein
MSSATGAAPRGGRRAWWAVAAVLALSRLLVFVAVPQTGGLWPYEQWVQEFQAAARRGVDFYSYHERRAQEDLERLRAQGRTDLHEESRAVEYPPLALAVIVLPGAAAGPLPDDGPVPDDWLRRYVTAYRLEMLLFDLLAFAVVAATARRLFPEETPGELAERLIVYLLATAALGPLLYNRLDIAAAALTVLALGVLVRGASAFWALLTLAVAVHFKLVPLVLAPWWALGTCPASWPGRPMTALRFLGPPLVRLLLLAALIAALFMPFWLLGGMHALDFLAYHRDRGLEIESTYGSLLLALRPLGFSVGVAERYGSYELVSPAADLWARLAAPVTAALLAAAGALLLRDLLRRPHEAPTPARTLAQAYPRLFVAHTLLVLMLAVAASKVFSPQYLLWLIPPAALAPFAPRPRRLLLWSLVGLCLLTTLIFPVLFWKHVVGLVTPRTEPPQLLGPTALGVAVLAARNALFVGLTAATAWLTARGGLYASTVPRAARAAK